MAACWGWWSLTNQQSPLLSFLLIEPTPSSSSPQYWLGTFGAIYNFCQWEARKPRPVPFHPTKSDEHRWDLDVLYHNSSYWSEQFSNSSSDNVSEILRYSTGFSCFQLQAIVLWLSGLDTKPEVCTSQILRLKHRFWDSTNPESRSTPASKTEWRIVLDLWWTCEWCIEHLFSMSRCEYRVTSGHSGTVGP